MKFYKIPKKYQKQAEQNHKKIGMYVYTFVLRKWYNPMRIFKGDLKPIPQGLCKGNFNPTPQGLYVDFPEKIPRIELGER